MSNTQDSEKTPAALDKAQEGRRLLRAEDYEGTIAACTEAMELDPGILGPYQTRAAAYQHLGMNEEAKADIKHLDELRNPITSYVGLTGSPKVNAVFTFGLGLGLVGLGMWGIIAPWATGAPFWWPTILGVIGVLLGLILIIVPIAKPAETTELAGMVTKKRVVGTEGSDSYHITVSRTEFLVTKGLYHSVSEGDDVVLTVSGPRLVDMVEGRPSIHPKMVIAITHGKLSTAQPLSTLEDKGMRRLLALKLAREERKLSRQADCAALENLGADARVLDQDSLLSEPNWVEKGDIKIVESPIRWGHHFFVKRYSISHGRRFYVPDPHLRPPFPWRKRQLIYSARVKWFPGLGPVKQVRWLTFRPFRYDTTAVSSSSRDLTGTGRGSEIRSSIIQHLSRDMAIAKKMDHLGFDLYIKTDMGLLPGNSRGVVGDANTKR